MIIDEVYIKEDLVYDKHSGSLVGFVNLGDINNHLLQFEDSLLSDPPPRPMAKTMLVFMVRGILSDLAFPYAQFSCSTLSGDLMVDPLWEAISRLSDRAYGF